MANYLERVASSAGRRAAIAKPPVSGPPVLPAGRDFSIAPADSFVIDEEQFVEPQGTRAPERDEIPSTPKVVRESTATQNETRAAHVEPRPKPRPTHERLSSESPFTLQVPRTLRPINAADIPPTTPNEPPRERPRVRASTTVGPQEFTIGEEPAPLVHSSDAVVNEIEETAEPDTIALTPRPKLADREEERRIPRPVHTEATPIPRVDHVKEPARTKVQLAEPSPPSALPVHLPPVAGNITRQEQSRISIGSLEVLVNNHPQVTKTRPAAASSRSESLNLEKRYLDRFRLRH